MKHDPKDTLTFLKYERETAVKRDSVERRIDFKEIYQTEENAEVLQEQAGRCWIVVTPTVNGNVRCITISPIG